MVGCGYKTGALTESVCVYKNLATHRCIEMINEIGGEVLMSEQSALSGGMVIKTKRSLVTCHCGWQGTENELDYSVHGRQVQLVCPCCSNVIGEVNEVADIGHGLASA